MANRLKYWRKRARLTQAKLGDLVGLSHVQISRLERGKSFFSEDSLNRIAAALRLEPQEIVSSDMIEPPEVAEAINIVKAVPPHERPRLVAMMRAFLPT